MKVYFYNGLLMYFTDRNTNRTKLSWDGRDFYNLEHAENKINQPYDEAFLSAIKIQDDFFILEHNEQLVDAEISEMVEYVEKAVTDRNTAKKGNEQ